MTKVIISPSILEYHQAMARTVEQVRSENNLAGVEPGFLEKLFPVRQDPISSEPGLAGLLRPPRIEFVDLDVSIRDGQLFGLLQVRASSDFGILNVCFSITDDQGNLIESDFAMRNEYYISEWAYILDVDAGDFRSVTVQAIVMDCLGGISIRTEKITL